MRKERIPNLDGKYRRWTSRDISGTRGAIRYRRTRVFLFLSLSFSSLSLSLSLFLPPFLFFLEGGSGGERIQFNREIRGCATIAPLSLPLSLFLSLSLSLFLSLFLSLSLSLPDPHHSSAALPSVFRRFFRRHAIFAGDMNSACSELLIFRGLRLRLPYNRA